MHQRKNNFKSEICFGKVVCRFGEALRLLGREGNGSGQTSPSVKTEKSALTIARIGLGIRIVVLFFVFHPEKQMKYNTLSAGTKRSLFTSTCVRGSPNLCVPPAPYYHKCTRIPPRDSFNQCTDISSG